MFDVFYVQSQKWNVQVQLSKDEHIQVCSVLEKWYFSPFDVW